MRRIAVVLALLSLAVAVIFPVALIAQGIDREVVVDDARVFGNRLSEVQAEAAKLQSLGADVRVRTILNYGAGNLDQYEQALELASPSWLDGSGNRKNNLIVFMVAVQNRQTGLYYGSYWEKALGSSWLKIQTDAVNPLFQQGDYAGGMIKGLQEIGKLVQSGGTTSVPATSPARSGGLSVGWIILIILVLMAVIIGGLVLFAGSRTSRARLLGIRQKAILAKQAAAAGINELTEKVQMLDIKVNAVAEKLALEEGAPLKEALQTAQGFVNRSAERYSQLSHSAGDPENPRLGESELTVIEPEYRKILDDLSQARASINQAEQKINQMQQTVDGFAGRISRANAEIEAVSAKHAELKQAGFKSNYPAELLEKGRSTLQRAQDLAAKKHYTEGAKYADEAGDQIKKALLAVEELPAKKQEARTAMETLETRIERVKEEIKRGSAVFDKLAREYSETTWEPVRGNGTEAENRVNWAIDALQDARAASGEDQQEWHKALEFVAQANGWLDEAESLMKSLSDLEQAVVAARRDAPSEITAAAADIKQAWDYIYKYDEDIRESLEDDLRAAEAKNEVAREELAKPNPDYLRVTKLAREANESADKILIQARSEHEAAERLRAKAASVQRDSQARVSIVSKYFDDHRAVIQSEARGHLNTAVQSLQQALAASDLNSRISLATTAESSAEQAYTLAQRDVNNSWQSPRPQGGGPRPQGGGGFGMPMPPIFIPRPGSGSSGGWGSSRPSSPAPRFPSSRPGGGGSTGWGARGGGFGGGGGRGGGGSSGW